MANNNNNNYEASLEWKNHSRFFDSLNEMLNEITDTEVLIYKDISNLYKYFALISALFSKHICYVNNHKVLQDRLNSIRKGLYNKEVIKSINRDKKNPNMIMHLDKIYNGLTNTYREIIQDLAAHELLPKVHKMDTSTPSAVRNLK